MRVPSVLRILNVPQHPVFSTLRYLENISFDGMELPKSSHTDLLIIGAGPAGLMAAAWASKFNISARIMDDKPSRIQNGHADGLTCRTMEILDSFGLAETVVKESFHDIQMRSWVGVILSHSSHSLCADNALGRGLVSLAKRLSERRPC